MKKEINIFIVSPNDVKEERNIAKEVCHYFDNLVGRGINVNAVLWEYQPMSYHKNAQENIDKVLDKCDIFVVILWHRLGSVIAGYEGAITKSKNVTGTQYEIEKILANKKEAVFFYFKTKEKQFLANELEEALRQQKLLDGFLMDIELTKGSTKHGYQEFDNSEEFREKLISHLLDEVQRLSEKKITIPKKKNSSKLQKYMYMFLYVLVTGTMFFLYMWYYFFPSFVTKEKVIKPEERNVKSLKSSEEYIITNKTKSNKKTYKLESEKIRVYSTNSYYLHYKKMYSDGFNFAMAQWKDLSSVSPQLKDAFILEKKQYSNYIKRELTIVSKRLTEPSSLQGEELTKLFYSYANSDDMYMNLTDTQMRDKLVKYMRLSKEELSSILYGLTRLTVKEN